MREILFRGKRKDNGEWVEGSLLRGAFYYDDREMWTIVPTDNVFYPRCEISSYEEVVPETVGQFTGLLDKNGTKIFEGDVVKCQDIVGKIDWNKTHLSFTILSKNTDGGMQYYYIEEGLCDNMTVIGNIHDNPEMLEVG